ncbi:hypothetical protein D2962_06460 [Biomaibacter acetigenes]|uniref:Copper amine oxidase n=2 Tax=Biomaibacter acetigenes TaxID=2316383 RepID=A0A3G2R5C4_9FIRM|nr:hypothetical protein D2962_06460 [Biomaibacter acetigenes]
MGVFKMSFKKFLPIIAILTVFFSFSIGFPGQAASQENIKIYIGGEEKLFDVPPQVFNGYTFLPIRGIFESLGAQVFWDNAQRRVTAVRKAVKISLKVGETSATVNGKSVKLDKAPLVYKGTTMVPVRFVSEALGEAVEWDQNARSVYIGGRAHFSPEFEPASTDKSFWQKAAGALGVGPRLITDGKITVDPISEGFSSEKILSYSMARSAIGVTANNMLLMVTVNRATIRELVSIMHSLGAYNAMNLDGGASSGLYYGGRYLTAPGRDLSNALIIYKKND